VVLHWLASGRIVSALLFLASVAALVHLFISPTFHVQRVQVQGNSVLQNELVSELSGLEGVPIWFVNRDISAERVLQNAYVEDVKISVALPDRATIKIAERRPEVRWAVGDVQYLVDGSGRVLDIAQEPADPDTLVIQDNTHHQLQLKDYIDTDALELARALTLRLPDELGLTPASIGWDIAMGVYVKTDAGQTIVFGQMDNLERKLAILHHLRQDGTAFTFLDLRPSNPYYRVEG
jgi:cell division protein FtsQ